MEDISLPFFSMKKIHYLLSTCIFPALPLSFNQSIIHTVSSSESFLSLINSHGNRHHFPRLLSGPLRHAGICLYITNFPLYLFPSLSKPCMCICDYYGQLQCETVSLRKCYGMTRITTHRNQPRNRHAVVKIVKK